MMWKLSTENSNFLFIRSTNLSSTELVLLLPSAIRDHLSLSFTFTILDTYASFNVQEDIRFFEVCSGKRSSNESKTACFTCKGVWELGSLLFLLATYPFIVLLCGQIHCEDEVKIVVGYVAALRRQDLKIG